MSDHILNSHAKELLVDTFAFLCTTFHILADIFTASTNMPLKYSPYWSSPEELHRSCARKKKSTTLQVKTQTPLLDLHHFRDFLFFHRPKSSEKCLWLKGCG
jgi:hypothetical protein